MVARGDGEATENWQKMIYRRGILYLNIASHLWQKRGKGEFVKRHVGKSELTKATAAHASEHEHVGQGGKTFREDLEVGDREFGLASSSFLIAL